MLRQSEIELLQTLFTLEQEQLHDFLYDFLLDYYTEEEITEDDVHYLYAQGDIPVLLVAHLDTVHKIKPKLDNIFHDQKKHRMWSPLGIGADDRCGVFAIVMLVMQGYRPHIAFTWNEEIGGIGARKMIVDFMPKQQINFAIQFERKGSQEAVYYYLDSLAFENYINSFGFKTHLGTYTDICEICPDWGFAGVNLSAGYNFEHSTSEIVMVDVLVDTMTKVASILDDQKANPQFFEYMEAPKHYTPRAQSEWNSRDEYYGMDPSSYSDYCIDCGKSTSWYRMSDRPEFAEMCIDCAEDIFPSKGAVLT
jgi:hypothetical protein